MKFSTRVDTASLSAAVLAKNYPQQKNLQEISKEEGISLKYLEQLFRVLKKNNLVKSQKGREGGYTLSKNPKQIKVGEIIEILEGPIVPMECASGKSATRNVPVLPSIVWTKLQTQIKKTLYSIKLNDLQNNHMSKNIIYLDNAATTQTDEKVLKKLCFHISEKNMEIRWPFILWDKRPEESVENGE